MKMGLRLTHLGTSALNHSDRLVRNPDEDGIEIIIDGLGSEKIANNVQWLLRKFIFACQAF
jgi:hypothetical protein